MAAKKKDSEEKIVCPVGTLFADLEKSFGAKSPFYKHMNRARIEFLKGIKSLLDERIERLEKKNSKKASTKMTRVKVE